MKKFFVLALILAIMLPSLLLVSCDAPLSETPTDTSQALTDDTTQNETENDSSTTEQTSAEQTSAEQTTEETTTAFDFGNTILDIPFSSDSIPSTYVITKNQTDVSMVDDEKLGRKVMQLSTNVDAPNDPYAEIDFASFSRREAHELVKAENYGTVVFKIKDISCSNNRFQLFYYAGKNTTLNVDCNQQKVFDDASDDWQYLLFELDGDPLWTGNVNGFRFDYIQSGVSSGESIQIASVIFAKDADTALKYLGYSQGRDELATLSPEDQAEVDSLLSGTIPVGEFDSYIPEEPAQEDNPLSLWYEHTYVRVPESTAKAGDRLKYRMTLAKNEIEACQLLLTADSAYEGLKISITDFTNKNGDSMRAELLYGHYFEVEGENIVDPLIPVTEDSAFEIAAKTSRAFFIKAYSEADTPAGEYSATVSLKNAEGDLILINQVFAYVWDFELPEETSCKTLVDIDWHNIYNMHKCFEGDDGLLYQLYYDMMLENRLCGYTLPYNVKDGSFSDSRINAYLNDPRVVAFQTLGWKTDLDASNLKSAYSYLSSNPEWLKKAYFYPVDEPGNVAALDKINNAAALIKEHYSTEYNLIAPMHINYAMNSDSTMDYFEYVADSVTAWCPKTYFYNTFDEYRIDNRLTMWMTSSLEKNLGSYPERVDKWQTDEGNEAWWYVTRRPSDPEITLTMETLAVKYRILFWQQKLYNVDGFLYYSINDWFGDRETDKGWNSKHEDNKTENFNVYGNGVLLYCGAYVDINGPVGSYRLECVRDGIEDFEYLTILEKELGKDKVDNIISKLTTSLARYNTDEEEFTQLREALGALIEKTLSEKANTTE